MNPLFLLFGLLGAGALGFSSSKSSTPGTADGRFPTQPDPMPTPPITETPTEPDTVPTPVVETPNEPVPTPPVMEEPEEPAEDPTPPVMDEPEEPAEDPTPPVMEEPEEPAEDPTPPVMEEPEEPAEDPTPPVMDEPEEPAEDPTPPVMDEPEEPAEDPTPPVMEEPEEPAEDPTPPVVETPDAPDQPGSAGSDGATTDPLATEGTVQVVGGRVATLEASGSDVSSVKIISGVEHGKVTVNPDNTMALVLTQTDFVGFQSFTYETTHSDGSTSLHQVNLDISPSQAANGWGTGEDHYMMATDANDRVIVEHGDNHQTVYVSASNSALSRSDIAGREGMSVNDVTNEWLAQSNYGNSEDLALDTETGMALWKTITPEGSSDTSNWLLFERGYTYENHDSLLAWEVDGASETNPILLGAWGEGERPVMDGLGLYGSHNYTNVVVQSLHFTEGVLVLEAENILFDDIVATDDAVTIQQASGITVHNSAFYDIFHTQEEGEIVDGKWVTGGRNFVEANFIADVDGLLLEGNFYDYNGWRDDYSPDGSADGGQPPIMFNHNLYVQNDNTDVTVRDMITMRASLNGAQIRSGGFIENNVYLDNNSAGSSWDPGYTLWMDNLITSGASKESVDLGFRASGMIFDGTPLPSLVDNIITHLADPNSDEAFNKKSDSSIEVENAYYDDTIVWNWFSEIDENYHITEQNVEGLDQNVLNQTTIQNFTALLLGQESATIEDLANYLRAQVNGEFDDVVDADLIIQFFQEGFGIAPDIRGDATTIRFVPDDLGEGVRWDNKLNWDTDDLPGLYADDNVDLGGNDVVFGSTAEIGGLDFGPDGSLNVYGGKLTVNSGMSAGEGGGDLNVEGSGQLWSEGSDGSDLDVDVGGGRFANTGQMSNTDLTATGGQTILATGGAEYDVSSSKTLAVFEAAAKVGFDGDDGGIAILDMQEGSTLAFAAQDGGLGTIEEFRSGAFGDSPDVQSGIDLGNADLSIDLAGLNASDGAAFTLMDADELVGIFNDANISGLGGRDARIVVDYENDSVTLELTSGSGSVSVDTIGEQSDVTSGEEALWNALTDGQGVMSETASLLPDEEEDDPLAFAA